MKKYLLLALAVLLSGTGLQAQDINYPKGQFPYENPYAFGLDLSFVLQAEQRGATFYDIDGTENSPWRIFRDHGFNWARLMICNEPSSLGQDLAYVQKGALKLKEITYIHGEGYAAGELKHGPLALIDEGIPVVVVIPQETITERP